MYVVRMAGMAVGVTFVVVTVIGVGVTLAVVDSVAEALRRASTVP